jgi:hypothetical protein
MRFKNFYLCPRCLWKWDHIWEADNVSPNFKQVVAFWSIQFGCNCPECETFCTPYFTDEEPEDE